MQRVRQGPWSWQSATIAATLPPAAAWTQFTVDLPALSGNATAMVPGIRIRNAGTLFLDDLGLTEIGGGGPTTQTLTVAKAGTGTGTVTSSPGGISCGADAARRSPRARADPLESARRAAPSGRSGACSGTGGCTVTMDQARSVTATFPPPPRVGSDSVFAGWSGACSGTGACTSPWTRPAR